jgi:hypothetical protein
MSANLKTIKQHPVIEKMGTDLLEQGRINSFAVDLSHWLTGASTHSLGLLARVTLMVVQEELESVRVSCLEQPDLAAETAAIITSALWPRLREGEEAIAAPTDNGNLGGPVLALLRECSGLDVPELLYLTRRLEAEIHEEDSHVKSTAKFLIRDVPETIFERFPHPVSGVAVELQPTAGIPLDDQAS